MSGVASVSIPVNRRYRAVRAFDRFGRVLAMGAGFLGLSGGIAAATAAAAAGKTPVAETRVQSESRALSIDATGRGLPRLLSRDGGTPPDVWGRSRACARMVARNRAISAGRRRG